MPSFKPSANFTSGPTRASGSTHQFTGSVEVLGTLLLNGSPVGTGGGDVIGPGSSTNNAIVRFDSTTGKLVQNSGVTVNDTNDIGGGRNISGSGDIKGGGGTFETLELGGVFTTNNYSLLHMTNGNDVTSSAELTFDGSTLELTGTMTLATTGEEAFLSFKSPTATWQVGYDDLPNSQESGFSIKQSNNVGPEFYIHSDGNVMIGTFTTGSLARLPESLLHVSSSEDGALFQVDGRTLGSILEVSGSGDMAMNAGSVTFARDEGIRTSGWSAKGIFLDGAANEEFLYQTSNQHTFKAGSSYDQMMNIRGNSVTGAPLPDGGVSVGPFDAPQALLHISSSGENVLLQVDGADPGTLLFVTGSGRVGIGTNAPQEILHVSGTSPILYVESNEATTPMIELRRGLDGLGALWWMDGAAADVYHDATYSGGNHFFRTNTGATPIQQLKLEEFNADHSGESWVGIGASFSPTVTCEAMLHVSSSHNAGLLKVDAEDEGTILFVTGSGRVGIGTDAPSDALHISATDAALRIQKSDSTNTHGDIVMGANGMYLYSRADSTNGVFAFNGYGGGSTTEFMRINSDGTVGIGTDAPTRALTVVGEISASAGIYASDLVLKTSADSSIASIYLEGTSGTEIIGTAGGNMDIRCDGGDLNILGGTGNELRFGTDNTNSRMVMDTAGDVGIGSTVPQSTLTVSGSYAPKIDSFTGTSNALGAHHTVLLDNSGGNVAVQLPAAGTCFGRQYIVKCLSDPSSNTGVITPNGSEVIEDESAGANYTFTGANESATLQSTGTKWVITSLYFASE